MRLEGLLKHDRIQHLFKHSEPDQIQEFIDTFVEYGERLGFKGPNVDFLVNGFLAQIQEETGGHLTPKRENLNYSCESLPKLFSHYRHNPKEALKDGRCANHRADQRKIACKAYNNRMGNKNQDGWMFRGAFYIQITGRENFTEIAEVISLILDEHYTAENLAAENSVSFSLLASMVFFWKHKMFKAKNINEMTKIVNKKTNTYNVRKELYLKICSL